MCISGGSHPESATPEDGWISRARHLKSGWRVAGAGSPSAIQGTSLWRPFSHTSQQFPCPPSKAVSAGAKLQSSPSCCHHSLSCRCLSPSRVSESHRSPLWPLSFTLGIYCDTAGKYFTKIWPRGFAYEYLSTEGARSTMTCPTRSSR